MKITEETLKFQQIDASFRHLVDNLFKYFFLPPAPNDLLFWKGGLGILEFGVGSGRSLRKIIDYVRNNDFNVHIMGFDSGEGLPEEMNGTLLFKKYKKGSYKHDFDKTIEALCDKNVSLYKYRFVDIPDDLAKSIGAAILINIDSDLYISAKQALSWCFRNNLIVNHTLISFDEYDTVGPDGGERKAFEEILIKYPQWRAKEIWSSLYKDKDTNTDVIQKIFEMREDVR